MDDYNPTLPFAAVTIIFALAAIIVSGRKTDSPPPVAEMTPQYPSMDGLKHVPQISTDETTQIMVGNHRNQIKGREEFFMAQLSNE